MTETIDTVTSRIQLPASFIRPASYVFRPLIDNTRPLSMGREITEFPLPFYRQEQIFSFTPAYSADSTASDAWSLCFFQSGRRGSNSLPSAWKADALPNELLPLISFSVSGVFSVSNRRFHLPSSIPKNLVGREGFEPSNSEEDRFTVCCRWPLGYLPSFFPAISCQTPHPEQPWAYPELI